MLKKSFLFFIFVNTSPLQAEVLISDNLNTQVTTDELSVVIENAPLESQKKLLGSPKQSQKIVTDLYKLKALSKQAQTLGLGSSDSHQFKLQKMIDEFYAKLLLDEYIVKKLPNLDKMAKKDYQVHADQYLTEEEVDISHIQIKTDCRSNEDAKNLAEDVLNQLKKGADFEQLVLEVSEDKGKKDNKGNLGRFKQGIMAEEFDQAAFAMNKPGQLSDIIALRDSYFIIRLNEKIPAKQKDFDEVEEELKRKLSSKLLESRREDLIVDLMEQNQVKTNSQALNNYLKEKANQIEAGTLSSQN